MSVPATMPAPLVRGVWQLLEPIHAVLYYAPEVTAEAAALGYDVGERWPSYFPLRSAPLGRPSAGAVTSTFYSFAPDMVARYMAAAWDVADPDAVLTALYGDWRTPPPEAERRTHHRFTAYWR